MQIEMKQRSLRNKYVICVSSLSATILLMGCADVGEFDKTADELVALMEKQGAVVPMASGLVPSQLSSAAKLSAFVTSALQSSPTVAAAQRRSMAAEARVTEANREFLPQVTISSDGTRTRQRVLKSSNPSLEGDDTKYSTVNKTAVASLRLLDLPKSAKIAAAESEAKARAADLDAAKQDLLRDILTSYFQSAEAIERWLLARAEVQFYQTRLEFERTEASVGELRSSDQSVSAAELARARSDVAVAAADYRIRADRLCGISYGGVCPYPSVASVGVPLPKPAPFSQGELDNIENAPEIRAMAQRVNVALREVDQARMAMAPRMSLEVAASERDRGGSLFDGSSLSRKDDATLLFEWDIYTSGRLRAIRDAELNEALGASHDYEAQLRSAVNDMRGATSALAALWQHDRALNRVISLRRLAKQEIERETKVGVSSIVDLAEARLELVRAEVLQQRTRRSYLAATVARARATGDLDDSIVAIVERVVSDNRYSARVYGPVKQ